VSLNNETICCEISEGKIAFCEKTAGLRRGKFSDSNSACLKVLVPVKIFQFQDMLNESERYQDAANGLNSHYYNSKDYHGLSFQPCDAWVECIERGIFINSDAGLKVA
jgi:hypothetical protein